MIAFGFSFPGGFYHATPWGRHANEADVAWPPEPVRILRSLIAAWFRKADQTRFPKPVLDDLVDALAAEPPLFSLPEAVHSHTRAFMPAPADKKLIYDAFLRLDRDAEVIAAWPTVALDGETSALAAHLVERLGYLGRAESWVVGRLLKNWNGGFNARPRALEGKEIIDADVVVLTDQTSESSTPVEVVAVLPPKAWASLLAEKRPELRDMKPTQRRLVASTLLDRLADAIAVDTAEWHAAGWSSPPPLQKIVYDRPEIGPLPPHPRTRGYVSSVMQPGRREVARFMLAGRPRPPVEDTLRVGEIARLAVMSRCRGQPPREIAGRDENGPLRDPGHTHAFYLPEDADGDGLIDHLIVYCRMGFSEAPRAGLDRVTRLWIEHGRADAEGERGRMEWRLALEAIAEPHAFADSPLLGSSETWTSATPYLKPRFDASRPQSFEQRVNSYRNQIVHEWTRRFADVAPPGIEPATDPARPESFAIETHPGAVRSTLAFARTRPSGRGGEQPDAAGGAFRLTFSEPVSGPIALGKHAHFGLGLFRNGNRQVGP
jgi:CRISPR-associated protein Csb2